MYKFALIPMLLILEIGGINLEHKEYNRIIDGGNTAILFIHGIIGSPNYFNDFITYIPDNWSISNMLLDGHGQGIDEFSNTSMKKWKKQVSERVDKLYRNHKNIIIMSHSMGTLLAIEQGIKKPNKVKALILLASPLRVFVKPKMLANIYDVFKKNMSYNNEVIVVKKACGIRLEKRIWRYVKLCPRYLELFAEIKATRKKISQLQIPCYAFQSLKDELVSISSCKVLNTNKNINTTVLKKSTHYCYGKDDFKLIVDRLNDLVVSYSD